MVVISESQLKHKFYKINSQIKKEKMNQFKFKDSFLIEFEKSLNKKNQQIKEKIETKIEDKIETKTKNSCEEKENLENLENVLASICGGK